MRAGLLYVAWGLLLCPAYGIPVRILPLGDSITRGTYNGDGNSYRKKLKELLSDAGYDTDFVGGEANGSFADNQHQGHDGWYAAHPTSPGTILGHISGWMASIQPDIILLHIGTNDINDSNGNNADANEVAQILDEIYAANSKATVVLARIIRAKPAYSRNAEITAYNSNLNVMAQMRIADDGDDLLMVDMENGAGIDYASSDLADDLHPSQIGYDKMAANWYPAVVSAIERQRVKQQPRIESISMAFETIMLEVSNLSIGVSNYAEQTGDLFGSAWTNVSAIIPDTTSTNWVLPASTNAAFFRITIP
ncbi:GDSL-type esterase/lipase family protein [Pontiella sulfatireligans]|uniref:Multidomain esterase n=1 Tax=Pontiella sulfatireligans TaxID=2750658 RepID=A0A6C2UME4_9BACT|nr:GDSL-type esterase/lipase family protein [Pontiella sulfatireligans]VGO20286.1 Multidomain esterase [Pontiella sulfatireligans]